MFNSELKERINTFKTMVSNLSQRFNHMYNIIHGEEVDDDIWDESSNSYIVTGTTFRAGLKTRTGLLEDKNEKLMAIVAELCDYVYKD